MKDGAQVSRYRWQSIVIDPSGQFFGAGTRTRPNAARGCFQASDAQLIEVRASPGGWFVSREENARRSPSGGVRHCDPGVH